MTNVNIDREVSSEGFVWFVWNLNLTESGGVYTCYSNNKSCCGNKDSID